MPANRDLRYVGDQDESLTDLGREQARALARHLGVLGSGVIGRVLSSPRRRAVDTAAPLARELGVTVEVRDELREQSYGDWEGRTRDEVRELGPEHAELLDRFHADPETVPPGGESFGALERRVRPLLEELASEPAGGVALVSHVGPIKAILARALDVPLIQSRRLFLDLATVSVVDWGPPSVLRLFNCHAHLGWQNARWLTPPGD